MFDHLEVEGVVVMYVCVVFLRKVGPARVGRVESPKPVLLFFLWMSEGDKNHGFAGGKGGGETCRGLHTC